MSGIIGSYCKVGVLSLGFLTACSTSSVNDQTPQFSQRSNDSSKAAPVRVEVGEDFNDIAQRFRAQQALLLQQEGVQAPGAAKGTALSSKQLFNAAEVAKLERQAEIEVANRKVILQTQAAKEETTEIARLHGQIELNDAHTERLNSQNTVLSAALGVADELVVTLSDEMQKYTNIDEGLGEPIEALNKRRLEELKIELKQLRARNRDLK